MFRFRLDGSTGVPPYLQLVHQVRQSLLLGYLLQGDRLPTVKDVAGDLAINPKGYVPALLVNMNLSRQRVDHSSSQVLRNRTTVQLLSCAR